MVSRFIWATANPVERAMWIREHCSKQGEVVTRKAFDLSEKGLLAIMAGAAWQPAYENPAINYINDERN